MENKVYRNTQAEKTNEINETEQIFYISTKSKQLFNEDTWENELKIYETEELFEELFTYGKNHISDYNRNDDICILTYKKLKEAKEYIALLESKLKNENKKDLDLDAILIEKEKKDTESETHIIRYRY